MVIDAAAEEGVGQVFFEVAGEDDDDILALAFVGEADALVELGDLEFVVLDFVEEVVWEVPRGFVDLVDEDDAAAGLVGYIAFCQDGGAEPALFSPDGAGDGETQGPELDKVFGGALGGLAAGGGARVCAGFAEMGNGVVVIEEVFGGAGCLCVINMRLGLESIRLCQLVRRPEGKLGFAGAGLAGQQQRPF